MVWRGVKSKKKRKRTKLSIKIRTPTTQTSVLSAESQNKPWRECSQMQIQELKNWGGKRIYFRSILLNQYVAINIPLFEIKNTRDCPFSLFIAIRAILAKYHLRGGKNKSLIKLKREKLTFFLFTCSIKFTTFIIHHDHTCTTLFA